MEPNQEYTQVPDLVMNWEKHAEGGGLMQQTKGAHSTAYERFVYVSFKLLFIPYLYTPFDSELRFPAICTTTLFF